MPILAPSIATPMGVTSSSTGPFTELDTHGQGEAPQAPLLTREDRTRQEKCCVSSSSTRSPSWSMIRKSMPSGCDQMGGNRLSLATNAGRVCAEIILKQRDEI